MPSTIAVVKKLAEMSVTSMLEYVSGWCEHGFESHSQQFLLTCPEADLSL